MGFEKRANYGIRMGMDEKNQGKSYSEYLKEDDLRNGAKRKERLLAAERAVKERKKNGIDITIRGTPEYNK